MRRGLGAGVGVL